MCQSRFPLSSDQLELLLAFESARSLNALSETIGRDVSVISRNLQRLGEDARVIIKQKGRWCITPLGKELNVRTRQYLQNLEDLALSPRTGQNLQSRNFLAKAWKSKKAAFISINAQMGLRDPSLGSRNNSEAELNLRALLDHWRTGTNPVIHIKHISANPSSAFFSKSSGSSFIPMLAPQDGELVIEKAKSSAFTETNLHEQLEKLEVDTVVIAGFTANECVDATARQASDFGFHTYVPGDATAMYDFHGPEGRLYKAEKVHRLTLANLNALFADVTDTQAILKLLRLEPSR